VNVTSNVPPLQTLDTATVLSSECYFQCTTLREKFATPSIVRAEITVTILSQSRDDPEFFIQPIINLRRYNLQQWKSLANTLNPFRSLLTIKTCLKNYATKKKTMGNILL
jgi:hypothetical protein